MEVAQQKQRQGALNHLCLWLAGSLWSCLHFFLCHLHFTMDHCQEVENSPDSEIKNTEITTDGCSGLLNLLFLSLHERQMKLFV